MANPTQSRLRLNLQILAVLFTFTGAVALILEQAFEKMLSTLLGSSTPAAATVLSVYFAGLSLGGLAYGHLIRPYNRTPMRVYALLEGGIGVCALLMYLFFDNLISLFVPLLALGLQRIWVLQCLRVGVAICWIFPITTLMGASFPAIVDSLKVLRGIHSGRAITRFYMFNLLGGFLGVIIGLYYIFPQGGIDGALLLSCGVNIIVCITAITIEKNTRAHTHLTLRKENCPVAQNHSIIS
jgi:spermidine synthase